MFALPGAGVISRGQSAWDESLLRNLAGPLFVALGFAAGV